MTKTITVIGLDCDVKKDFFQANPKQACISLTAANTQNNIDSGSFHGEPIDKCSLFIEGVELEENQTLLRDNKEVLTALVKGGFVKETGYAIKYGLGDELAHIVEVLF